MIAAHRLRSVSAVSAVAGLVAMSALWGAPSAAAVEPPAIDPAAVPPDGQPGPQQAMRQGALCTRVGTLPGTDYRIQPKYMDLLNLPEAWKFGRGAGVSVALIDTGVSPHPRLPTLVGGGDYIEGGDGLTDCDAHGTWIASLIAAWPNDGNSPPPPPREVQPPPAGQGPPPAEPGAADQSTPPASAPTAAEGPAGWTSAAEAAPGVEPAAMGQLPSPEAPAEAAGDPPSPAAPPPWPPPDAFSGIAPEVKLISIRQSSLAWSPQGAFGDSDPVTRRKAGDVATMASAIVHAANMGAKVINISEVSCMPANKIVDQRALGAAIRYAAVDKDVVIVAAAGNLRGPDSDCKQNPLSNPLTPDDPRNWAGVTTVVTPAWFSDYVLTVGAVNAAGNPLPDLSIAGPWVGIAAPGTDVMSLSPRDAGLINAEENREQQLVAPAGTSFSAAIVTGTAALVRAKFPQLTAHQVINRLIATARPPAAGVDNEVGHGIVDPVAALTYDLPAGEPLPPQNQSSPLVLPPPPPPRDMTPVWVALGGVAAIAVLATGTVGLSALLRERKGR